MMEDRRTPLALAGSLERPLRWLSVLGAIPFAITLAVLGFIVTAHGAQRAAPPLLLLIAIPVPVLLAQLALLRSIRRIGVAIEGATLIVDTGLGTKRVALAHLRARGVRVVDLAQRDELRPMLRLWGTGVPGLSAGWFRLRNGERAVCLLLGRERVCYLRSEADGLSLLLSLRDPDALRALIER